MSFSLIVKSHSNSFLATCD